MLLFKLNTNKIVKDGSDVTNLIIIMKKSSNVQSNFFGEQNQDSKLYFKVLKLLRTQQTQNNDYILTE